MRLSIYLLGSILSQLKRNESPEIPNFRILKLPFANELSKFEYVDVSKLEHFKEKIRFSH